jgi:hypothetical protein
MNKLILAATVSVVALGGAQSALAADHSPEGYPADVSEADRYKYPDCN